MKLSIVIPFYNEAENVDDLLREVRGLYPDAEIVAVNDGSTDATESLIRQHPDVRLVSFPKNLGQSAALYAGMRNATGDLCAMLDGDGQNDPAYIGRLVEEMERQNADMACGYRMDRDDPGIRLIGSRIANAVRKMIVNDGIRDAGCTLKVLKRKHVRLIIPFNHLHLYIPAFLRKAGLKIVEVGTRHRPRQRGISKYNIFTEALPCFFDLLGTRWLLSRQIYFDETVLQNPISE